MVESRASRAPLLSAAEARRRLAEAWPRLPTESIPLAQSEGRALSEALVSPEDLPSFARAAMDGFAVPAGATQGASSTSPVQLALLQQAWPIATGGAVPAGADAVVMIENTRPGATHVAIHEQVAPGRNIIAQGQDVRRAAALLPAGWRLSARDLALLGAVGIGTVAVAARPRVAVISSGAELVAPDQPAPPGRVRDVNQPALVAAARAAGALVTPAGIVNDEVPALAAILKDLAATHDLVLISGGTSVGLADYTAAALRHLGAPFLFHGLAIRPGRPMLAARLGDTLVLGLPGVPTAALVVYEIFVRPLLDSRDRRETTRLTVPIVSAVGREDYVRVTWESRADGRWATPVVAGPSSLLALASADGVAIVPPEISALDAGDLVTVLRF